MSSSQIVDYVAALPLHPQIHFFKVVIDWDSVHINVKFNACLIKLSIGGGRKASVTCI